MDITSAAGSLAAPTACASCVFGAYSSKILSFTSSYIEHITVSVTPHITVYTNGSRSTSFESNTLTESSIVGGIAGTNSSKTYAKKNDIKWTVDGATLTYPTKYVQYVGFKGAPAATEEGETCGATTEASEISLPATTDAASFIYALPANATALALPTQLLQYLGGLEDLVEQFDGASLSGCAPLDGAPYLGGNGSILYPVGGNGSNAVPPQTILLPSGYVGSTGGLTSQLSGYAGPSAGVGPHSSLRPTGYITASVSTSGYKASSSGVGQPSSPRLTGYLSTSSRTSSAFTELVNSGSASESSEVTSSSHSTSSVSRSSMSSISTITASNEASTSSQKSSILPYPYLNTTSSRSSSSSHSSSSSEPGSYAVPESSTFAATTSDSVSIRTRPSSSNDETSATSRTSTFTAPGGIFIPSHIPGHGDAGEEEPTVSSEVAATTTRSVGLPPKGSAGPPHPGTNDPEGVPPDDDNDGDDGAIPSTVAGSMTTPHVETPAASAPAYETPPPEGENVHTTAFVIEPITGSALITYQSEPTKVNGPEGKPLDADSGNDSGQDIGGHAGYVDEPEPTATPDPDVSNLIDQIGNIASEGQDSSNDESNNDASDTAPLPGYDDASDDGSGQNQPGGNEGTPDQQSYDQTSGVNGDNSDSSGQDSSVQQQGPDLSGLNSAINSVANQQAGSANNAGSQATSPSNVDSPPGSVYSADNTVVTAQAGGAVVIGEQTVVPGQSITVGSGPSATVIALETGDGNTNLVVGGSTFEASPGNIAITAQSNGAVVFKGSTVQPGPSVTVGSGSSAKVVALQTDGGSTNLIVEGSTVQVLPGGGSITTAPDSVTGVSSMALITTNGQTITAVQSGSSLILQSGSSTATVSAGKAATFAGETILAVPTEDAVFVNGNITPLTAAEGVEGASQAVMTANGHTITAMDSGNSVVLVDGSITKTLQDGSAIVFQGQTISAQERGMAVVVNGHTSSLTSAMAFATGQAVVTADGRTYSVLDLPGFVVLQDGSSSLTVRDGATATFDGQTITALQNGQAVVVDGKTMSMTEPVGLATAQAVITAGDHIFTAQDMDGYIIIQDGTSTITVKDGQTAIFDGQTVTALASGDAVLVNGQTKSFTSVEATATDEVNQYINKGLSGGSTSSQTVGAASSEPTDSPDANSASVVSPGWTGLVAAGLFGIVAVL